MDVHKLLIQSKDRISGNPSDFVIQVPPMNRVRDVNVVSASVPNTIYNITADNNTIYWYAGSDPLSATIAPGAYSITALTAALVTAMIAADPNEYSVSYNYTTMKISIECDVPILLTCSSTNNAIWDVIGFLYIDRTPAVSHTADDVVSLDFPAYLMVGISELASARAVLTSDYRADFSIPLTVNSQYLKLYSHKASYDNESEYSAGVTLSRFSICLRNADGEAIDLNRGEWSMLLHIEYCRCKCLKK